jgi:hypothetical protein
MVDCFLGYGINSNVDSDKDSKMFEITLKQLIHITLAPLVFINIYATFSMKSPDY